MLDNFFKLNSTPSVLGVPDAAALEQHFRHSDSLQNAVVSQGFRCERQKFGGKRFENVKLNRAEFVEVTFRDCAFVDCLFIGARFEDCEFHECRFENCNTYKIHLHDVYVNPRSFVLDKRYRRTAANIGVYLFQQLHKNAAAMHHADFSASADIERRRWFRYYRAWELKKKGRSRVRILWHVFPDVLADGLVKYGYGPVRFLGSSAVVFLMLAVVARLEWTRFGMTLGDSAVEVERFGQALYYCMLLTTTLGFSDVVPTTGLGRSFAILCAGVGIAWAGLFTSILVRRVIR